MNSETLVVGRLPLSSNQIYDSERADLTKSDLPERPRNLRENISKNRPLSNINNAWRGSFTGDRAVKPKFLESRTFPPNVPTAHRQLEGSETREDHPCSVPEDRQSASQNPLQAVTASSTVQSSLLENRPSTSQNPVHAATTCPIVQHPQVLSPDYADPRRVPGTDQNIYPRARINPEFHERYPQLVDFFKQAVDTHKFLKYHTSKINYELRLCGCTPSNAVASIIIFCAEALFKDLRSLLNSKHIRRQYQPINPSLRDKFQFASSKPHLKASAPIVAPFKIVFWREATTPTQRKSAMEQVVAKSHSFLTMCGSLVRHGNRTSTLGLLIRVDSKLYGLTVDHLFKNQRGEEQPIIANEPDILPDEDDPEDNQADWPWIDDVKYEGIENDGWVSDNGSVISGRSHAKETMDHALTEHYGASINGHKVDSLSVTDTATPYLDWALIEFDDGYYERPNAFYLEDDPANPKFLERLSAGPKTSEVNVFMISGVSGTRKGMMLNSNSYIGGKPSENLCQAWNVILSDSGRVIDGDCGSLIVDQETLEVYGHVVASNPLGEAYVVPLQNTFHQISNALGAKDLSLPNPGLLMESLVTYYSKVGDSGVADEAKQILASMEGLSSTSSQHDVQDQVRQTPAVWWGLNLKVIEELENFGPFSILIRRLPANITEDTLRSMVVWSRDFIVAKVLSPEKSEDPGFRSAILRFKSQNGAIEAKNILNGKPSSSSSAPVTRPLGLVARAPQRADYYDCEQPDDQRPLQSFHQHLAALLIPAENPTSDQAQTFVPFQDLADYLIEGDRLTELLSAIFSDEDHLPVEVSVVGDTYLKALCVLLSIGKAKHIRHFCEHEDLSDSHIPFHSKPTNFPITTTQPALWDLFFEKQWTFCAAEMTFKVYNSLDEHRILPIVERQELARGGGAIVSRIVLHHSFNKLRREGSRDMILAGYKHTFVLKTYHDVDGRAYYENEVEAFRRLRPLPGSEDPNIIHFYGSYTQNGTYNVILDFADQGNLEQYFKNVLPPTSGGDIERFWASLCGILKALVHIHAVDVQNNPAGPQILQGWHQDIKPENILVKSNSCDSPYDWNFILSDLGLSHFKRTSIEASDIDAYGTQTYGAPECYREDRFLEDSPLPVKQNADIWSFACIVCEAAVWLIHGYPGLQKFRKTRKHAIAANSSTKDGDWFHNGQGEVLPVVLETIENLKDDFRNSDHITGEILEQLAKTMLDVPEGRPSAKQSYLYANRIIKKAKNMHATQVSLPQLAEAANLVTVFCSKISDPTATIPEPAVAPNTRSPISLDSIPTPAAKQTADTNGKTSILNIPIQNQPGPNPSISSTSSFAPVTLVNRMPIIPARTTTPTPVLKSSRRLSLQPGSTRPLPMLCVDVAERWMNDRKAGRFTPLQDDPLLRRLETRDHVFLIDDAGSMASHEPDVKRILSILAYFLKNADPDGMELYFAGAPGKFKSKEPMKLVEKFVANKPKGVTNIKPRLTSIINGYIDGFEKSWLQRKFKPMRSLNIYVLTDGIWQPSIDLAPPIKRLLAKLEEHGKFQVGIQFISFGKDTEALKRLDKIDEGLGLNEDIIDHEPSTGNVWKMLFGSTDPWFDGSKKV